MATISVYWYAIIGFLGLLWLTRWITKHVQGIGYLVSRDGEIALTLYLLLTLPGVLLHELSHALAAWLLRVKVRHLSIGIRRKRGQQVSLGTVDIARTDPVRASLIGLAPLVSGSVAILLISQYVFGINQLAPFSIAGLGRELGGIYQAPDFWLWAYLVFAIGNTMFPSAADRRSWWVTLLLALFVGAILYLAGLLDEVGQTVGGWGWDTANRLSYAFAVIWLVDLVVIVILFLTEKGLAWLGAGRIQYKA